MQKKQFTVGTDTLDVIIQEDGIRELDKKFESEKEAKKVCTALASRYTKLGWEIISTDDPADPDSPSEYAIIGRVKEKKQEVAVDKKEINLLQDDDNSLSLQSDKYKENGILESVSQREYGALSEGDSRIQEKANQLRRRIEEASRDASQGERESSEGVLREKEINQMLESEAKESGLWIPITNLSNLGSPFLSGNENNNYLDAKNGTVYKMNNLINSGNLRDLFKRIDLHNAFSPQTKYSLVGFTGFGNGGAVYPIYKQDYVDGSTFASTEEIDIYMRSLGFEQTGEAAYSNGKLVVSDLHPRNVLKSASGNIYVVDAELKLEKKDARRLHISNSITEAKQEVETKVKPLEVENNEQKTVFPEEAEIFKMLRKRESNSPREEVLFDIANATKFDSDQLGELIGSKRRNTDGSYTSTGRKKIEFQAKWGMHKKDGVKLDPYAESLADRFDMDRLDAYNLIRDLLTEYNRGSAREAVISESAEQAEINEQKRQIEEVKEYEEQAITFQRPAQAKEIVQPTTFDFAGNMYNYLNDRSNHKEFVQNRVNELHSKVSHPMPTTIETNDNIVKILHKKGISQEAIERINEELNKGAFGFTFAGAVYLSSDNCHTQNDIDATWIHEQLIHGGARILFPSIENRRTFFEGLYNKIGETRIQASGLLEAYAGASKSEIAEEYIAHLSEKIFNAENLSQQDISAWQEFIASVKEWINRLFETNTLFNDSQLKNICQLIATPIIGNVEFGGGVSFDPYSINNDKIPFRKTISRQDGIILNELRSKEREVDINPSEEQKQAGNYRKGHISIDNLDISIENPKGSRRTGIDEGGKPWSITMNNTYGYIKGTKGKDGDHIDVFFGENIANGKVFVIDQSKDDGSFDEHKVMYGFVSEEQALEAYLSNYNQGWNNWLAITEVSKEDFKNWIDTGTKKAKPFAEYKISKGNNTQNEDIRFREDKSFRSEEQQIIDEAKKNNTYLLAPNGKTTNLNEKQWVQVRTKAFKDWFGDWEKATRIEKLRNSKTIEITGEEYKGKYELNRTSIRKFINSNLRGEYVINDTGEKITLVRESTDKLTSHSMSNDAYLKSIVVIPRLIENAVFIDELPNQKSNDKYDSYRYYVVGLNVEGSDYTAKLTVGVDKNGNKYYDHALTQIEKGSLIDRVGNLSAMLPQNDETSLSDAKDTKLLLILQNNSSKVVDENGEPMVVYHGTGRNFTEFEAVQSSNDFPEAMYFSKSKNIANTYSGYKGNIFNLYLNIKNPYIVDAKNKDFNSYYDEMANGLNYSKANDYDGYIVKNIKDDWAQRDNQKSSTTFVTFLPSQIKSATDNTGAFSKDSDDIRFRKDNDFRSEEQQIIDEAKKNGAYMLAPNGKPTNLSEKQWAQVRTKAFKDWFGDWEKTTRIEKLKNSKTIEITGEEITSSEDVKQYRRNALEYGKALRGKYVNKDTGEKIAISRASLTEVLSHSISDDEHIQSIAAIPLIIENAIHVDTVVNEDLTVHKDVGSYDYYLCGLNIGGEDYTVKAVVANAGLGVRYYDHKLTQIEKGKLLSVSPVIHKSGSDNNLPNESDYSNLSDIKDKRLFSILQNNSSKVVDENGEPMVMYHGTGASFNAFNGGAFFTDDYMNAEGYAQGENVLELFLNIRTPFLVQADGRKWNDLEHEYGGSTQEIIRSIGKDKDGVIFENINDSWIDDEDAGAGSVFYAFSPSQIKSATDNTGKFNTMNDDIRFRKKHTAKEQAHGYLNSLKEKAILFGEKNKNKETPIFVGDVVKNWNKPLANPKPLFAGDVLFRKSIILEPKDTSLFVENHIDSDISIKNLQDFIVRSGGRIVNGRSNVYDAKNHSTSRIMNASLKFEEEVMLPLLKSAKNLVKVSGTTLYILNLYTMAKHMPHRNEAMRKDAAPAN